MNFALVSFHYFVVNIFIGLIKCLIGKIIIKLARKVDFTNNSYEIIL